MAFATSDIIIWAKISQYLSENEIVIKGAFDGGRKDKRHPQILYTERKSLEYLYDQDPSSDYLFEVGNYVLALCGDFLSRAQYIAALGGGGTIVNPTTKVATSIQGFRIEEQVASGNTLEDGDTSYVISIQGIVEGSINVVLPQDNIPQGESNQFSYTIVYGANSATISFLNIVGSTNYGVIDGMLIIITGLKFIAV